MVVEADKKFMEEAIVVARESSSNGEYAIGAVIVKDDVIIATGEVRRNRDLDPTAHAEIISIRKACAKLQSKSLNGCVIYSTQECCPMCAAAVVWANMEGIVFGAYSVDVIGKGTKKFTWRQMSIGCQEVIDNSGTSIKVLPGFMREECLRLIKLSQ